MRICNMFERQWNIWEEIREESIGVDGRAEKNRKGKMGEDKKKGNEKKEHGGSFCHTQLIVTLFTIYLHLFLFKSFSSLISA